MMSIRFNGPCKVHLHWVRETSSRVLESPVSVSLPSTRGLPRKVADAVRACGRRSIELHLPFFSAQFHSMDAWAEDLQFTIDSAGRMVGRHAQDADPVLNHALDQATILVWRAMSGDETPLTIAAEPAAASTLLTFPAAVSRACEWEGGLSPAPFRGGNSGKTLYRQLSVELQRITREWVPAHHLQSPADLEDRTLTMALLAWSAAEPVARGTGESLSIDVLDDAALTRAFFSMQKNFPERLRLVESRHTAYSRRNAARLLRDVQRSGMQHVRQLFHAEGRLLVSFVDFCARMPEWRERYDDDPVRATRALHREVREALRDFCAASNHFYRKRPQKALLSRFLVEGVRKLETWADRAVKQAG